MKEIKKTIETKEYILEGDDKLYLPLRLWGWDTDGINEQFGGEEILIKIVHPKTNKRSLKVWDGRVGGIVSTGYHYSDIGKRIFLTWEDALRALDDYDRIGSRRKSLEMKG